MIGLYQEPGWKTVTALLLPETTDSLFCDCARVNGVTGSLDGWSWWSYNDLAGRNGSGFCGDATMLRGSPVGSSRR